MTKVLVTGGAGFIGSHIVEAFAKARHDVWVIDDLSSGKLANLAGQTKVHEIDVRSAECAEIVRVQRFDVICHLAAQIDVRKSVENPRFDADVNIGGSLNLLEAIRQSGNRSTRFIFSSTGGALYGEVDVIPTPENFAKDPQSPYGNAKLSVELYLGYYARVHGMDTVALRYGNVYGPRQDSHGEAGVVAIFCERILAGKQLTIFGDGSQTRDYVYVGDVARANLLASTAVLPPPGALDSRSFNIGTGIETSVLELARLAEEASGRPVTIENASPRAGEVQRSCLAASKAGTQLGWIPAVSLDAGVRETFDWFQREALQTDPRA